MAAESTRKSRMALVLETQEGVYKAPSSGADFLALQSDFGVESAAAQLDNEELKASIGASQSLIGLEEPTISVSHYVRASGVEGVAPQAGYSNLYKGIYGQVDVEATQYVTTVGSTTTLIKVAVSSNFSVGQALLIKHSAFEHEIAVIYSIPNGTDLIPMFKLENAPATGTSLGKAVSYRAKDDHPSFTCWDYRANGGARQAVAGVKIGSMSIEATGAELINASFEGQGTASAFNALVISATNKFLDFNDGTSDYTATLVEQTYKHPHALAESIATKMNGAGSPDTFSCIYDDITGKFTISSSAADLTLEFSSGANTANTIASLIGFAVSDFGPGTTFTGANPIDLSSPYTPSLDQPGTPLVAKGNHVMVGTQEDNICFEAQSLSYELTLELDSLENVCSDTGSSGVIATSREVMTLLTAYLPKYKSDLFKAFIDNTLVRFQYAFGEKTGAGNWIPGKCGVVHIKDCSVQTHTLADADGSVTLEIELKGAVDGTNPETAINFL